MNEFTPYLHEYESLCRAMTPEEQTEENALAFKAMRAAARDYDLASQRWLVICGVRLETTPETEEAEVIDLIPRQRTSESLVREEL